MNELELLFLVLACLYGWECLCWLKRGSVGFITWLGLHWRAVQPGSLAGNQHGSFIFAPPLPPLGYLLTGNQFPISLSSEGVLGFVASNVNPGWRPQQTGRFFRFDEIKNIEAKGKKLLINGELLLKAGSPALALYVGRSAKPLASAPLPQRAATIEKIFRESFDTKAVKKRWYEFKKLTAVMRWLVNVLFGYLFVLAPWVVTHFGLKHTWIRLLIGLFALTTAVAFLFRRAHKTFYPEAEEERFTHFLTIWLSPVTSIRALDILSRHLLETFHPLAIARVFCSPEQFRELAGKTLRDVHFPALPVCPPTQPGAAATEQESRTLLRKTMEVFLRQGKIDPGELIGPPKRLDETCRAYCPRCQGQFTNIDAVCSDCGGLPLKAFEISRSHLRFRLLTLFLPHADLRVSLRAMRKRQRDFSAFQQLERHEVPRMRLNEN